MSDVFNWPAAWPLRNCSVVLSPNVQVAESPYTKSFQGVDLLGERFVMRGQLDVVPWADGGEREAFFNRLRGVHWISAWHFRRPAPLGTQRGTPTLSAAVAQGHPRSR